MDNILCRLCMNSNTDLLNFNEMVILNFTPKIELRSYGDLFQFCTRIEMLQEESLPESICTYCSKRLIVSFEVIQQAIESDIQLRKMLKKSETLNKSIVHGLHQDKRIKNSKLTKFKSHHLEVNQQTIEDDEKDFSRKPIEEQVADIINIHIPAVNIDPLIFEEETKPIKQSNKLRTVQHNEHLEEEQQTEDFDRIMIYSIKCLSEIKNSKFLNSSKISKFFQAKSSNSIFKCSLCRKQFLTEFVLNSHTKSHNQRRSLQIEPKIEVHRKIQKLNFCSTSKKSSGKRRLSSIFRQKINFSKNKREQCTICKRLIHETLLELHINRDHKQIKPYSCAKCKTNFYTKKSYIIHKGREFCNTIEHLSRPKTRTNSNLSTLKQNGKKSSGLYLCSKCPKTLNSLSSLVSHLEIHDENRLRKFQCQQCSKRFYTNSQYLIHLISHNDTKFPCDICGKVLNRKESLKCHKRLHNERIFECVYCQKKFTTKATLDLHIRFHTGEYKFECEICSQKFYMRGHYTYHMNSHNGVRYQCPYCDKYFNTPTAVREHKYNHTGMPYNCNLCTKGYPSKYKVCQHIRTCHKIENPNDKHYKKVYGGKFSENRSKNELHIKKVILDLNNT